MSDEELKQKFHFYLTLMESRGSALPKKLNLDTNTLDEYRLEVGLMKTQVFKREKQKIWVEVLKIMLLFSEFERSLKLKLC